MDTLQYYESNRGVILKGFELRGFQNTGLDGVYEVKRDPGYMIHGTCPRNGLYPTPTFWNRDAPLDSPVFMYWQYYKDHYSVCPYFDGHQKNMWDQVKNGTLGEEAPGLAFFKWEENAWYEFDGNAGQFVRRPNIVFSSFGRADALPVRSLIPSTPGVVAAPGRMPTSRTPPPQRLIPRTPGMSAPRTPVMHGSQPATQQGIGAPQTPPLPGQQGLAPAAVATAAKDQVVSSDSDPALAQELLRYKNGASGDKRQKLLPKKEELSPLPFPKEEECFDLEPPSYLPPVSSTDAAAAPDTPLYDPSPT